MEIGLAENDVGYDNELAARVLQVRKWISFHLIPWHCLPMLISNLGDDSSEWCATWYVLHLK
jgi:hypothetical protein